MNAEQKKRLNELKNKPEIVTESAFIAKTLEKDLINRKEQLSEIKQAIEQLADALNVNVEINDLSPLVKKLEQLSDLPDSFQTIKDLSSKIHIALTEDKEISIKGFRELWELHVRDSNKSSKAYAELTKETVQKFADLQTYISQLSETLKQGQDPEDFKPVRIVIGGDGTALKFLSNMPSSRGGGGSGGSSGGLTDAELRATPVDVNATIDTSAVATSAKQSDGSQKTQIVDAGGEAATITGGKLDVNASIDTTGLATNATDTNTAATAVSVDSIDDKTPALGQALAAASVPVILPSATITTLTPPAAITGFATSAKQDTAQTSLDTIAGDTTAIQAAVEILDNAISGSEMQVDIVGALPAGTAAIGKLAANSGVDIGDVDVTSISAGTNLVGDVGIQPRTTNGFDTFMASGSDGSSILVATVQAVKASAGKVYGYYAYNPEAAVTFVHFYNTASGSVTVGTTNPLFTLQIPPASAANLMSEIGITFGTAIAVAATTTAGGNTAPATGASLTVFYK